MSALVPAWMPPNTIRRWRSAARKVFDAMWCDGGVPVRPFGKENVWQVYPQDLDQDSIILSGGVGKDISTELELVAAYGCHIDLFDPSPTGIETMSRPSNRIAEIEFHPQGLAGTSGQIAFSSPVNPAEGSFTVNRDEQDLQFACTSLSDFAASRGYKRIDLLKLDIEGFEYEVIDDLLANGPPINQMCIEFHHFEAHISWRRTAGALRKLGEAGFRVVYKDGSDYTLLHMERLGLR